MTDYEELEDVDIWGFSCKLTTTQLNEFREYFRGTDEHKEMFGIQDVINAHVRKGEIDDIIRINKKWCDLDLIMFKMAKLWYQTHIVDAIPDSLPNDL